VHPTEKILAAPMGEPCGYSLFYDAFRWQQSDSSSSNHPRNVLHPYYITFLPTIPPHFPRRHSIMSITRLHPQPTHYPAISDGLHVAAAEQTGLFQQSRVNKHRGIQGIFCATITNLYTLSSNRLTNHCYVSGIVCSY